MSLTFVKEDITRMDVDAVVNAANSALAPGGGVCGAIFRAAGYEQLDRACRAVGGCPTGQAVITPGFDLIARFIIHAVGPIWTGGGRGERELLSGCYRASLELAHESGCRSIAFPLISSGIYGYPREEALEVAVDTIEAFLRDKEMAVYLSLFDPALRELCLQRRPRQCRW